MRLKINSLTVYELENYLRQGIVIELSPFTIRLQSELSPLTPLLHKLYAHYFLAEDDSFADIQVRIVRKRSIRNWLQPEAQIWVYDNVHSPVFPQETTLPFLEWGINWCVATRAHHYLLLHTGVVEKNGQTVLLPASPGSGKSTLCTALIHRGWRLLSDEFGLVRPADLAIVPFPRLIPLKNESIAVIRAFVPDAVLGPEFPKTRKGTISHLRPPAESIARAGEIGRAAWIVCPQFQAGAETLLLPLSRTEAFIKLSRNSFNYARIGLRGFETVGRLVESCSSYSLKYSDLEEAIAQLEALVTGEPPT